MTQTLQEAMLKAGLISQEKLKKAEADKKAAQREQRQQKRPQATGRAVPVGSEDLSEPARRAGEFRRSRKGPPAPLPPPPPKKKPLGFLEGKHHHHSRTDCEACGRPSPDVEYYEHKNRSLDKFWLCVRCADDNNIHDDFRQTMQSPQAMKGLFQRGYGPTKIFKKR